MLIPRDASEKWLARKQAQRNSKEKKNETHKHGGKILDVVPGGAAEMKVVSTTQWKG